MTASTNGEEKTWKFAQCFGDKGDSEDVTEGKGVPFFGRKKVDKVY